MPSIIPFLYILILVCMSDQFLTMINACELRIQCNQYIGCHFENLYRDRLTIHAPPLYNIYCNKITFRYLTWEIFAFSPLQKQKSLTILQQYRQLVEFPTTTILYQRIERFFEPFNYLTSSHDRKSFREMIIEHRNVIFNNAMSLPSRLYLAPNEYI